MYYNINNLTDDGILPIIIIMPTLTVVVVIVVASAHYALWVQNY